MSFNNGYNGLGQDLAITMKGSGITRDTDSGKPAKVSANLTLSLAADGDPFIGVLGPIEKDLVTSLIPEGVYDLPYSGTAPGLGVVKIVCNGAGGVKVDATNGYPVTVLNVDTANTRVIFLNC